MIEQQVQVIAIEGNRLLVEAERQSSCLSCSVKNGCGTSVLAKWFDKKHLRFYVDNYNDEALLKVSVGDTVSVGLQESALTQGALTVYLIPLLVMIGVALLINSWLPGSFYWRDLVIAGAALMGLLLGLVAGRFYLHQANYRQHFNPVLLARFGRESHSEKI